MKEYPAQPVHAETLPTEGPSLPPGPLRDEAGYRFPPGLKLNLPFYLFKKFFRPADPIALFEHLARTYGRIAHYKLGFANIVFLNHPDLVREVLVTQGSSFIKERTQRRLKILLGEGLITSEGEFHMRQRRIAAPAFHRQRIAAYGQGMVARAAAMRDSWQPGHTFDISAAMMELSLEIVARTLFATEVTDDIRAINREVNVIMGLYNFLVALPRAERYLHLPIPGLMQFKRARRKLDAVVHRIIREHRSYIASGGADRGDLLSMLVSARDDDNQALPLRNAPSHAMSDEQLRDEVLTIFLAGYETTANALTWTWYLLSQNPEAESRMFAEIQSVLGSGANSRLPALEDLPRLRYTEQVFAESMRLYPPVWAMGRESTRPVELGEYRFPAGTYFYFSQYIIQRDPANFPDPLRFDPDRFTPEQKAARPRFAYFPFGGGGRQCIGEAFAWMEGVLILATIAQKWRLEFQPGQQVALQPKITLRPKFPMTMTARAR